MPKREKTPPPADDEPKYLIIYNPYPHAQLAQPGDAMLFCQWMAHAMGSPAHLLAWFERPLSSGCVIIEVHQDYPDFSKILGAHKWENMFKVYPDNYRDTTSSIFYCALSSGRQVEKHGWKRKYPPEAWFSNEKKRKEIFATPYPAPKFAAPPIDSYGKNLCLPLPSELFPNMEPLPKLKPVVGSEEWAMWQTLQSDRDFIRQADSGSDQDLPAITGAMETTKLSDHGDEEPPVNLWASTEEDGPMSDLGYVGAAGTSGENSCPYHGMVCKKGWCAWRADYEKEQLLKNGPKKGGPSNIKNYRTTHRQDPNQRADSSNGYITRGGGRGRGSSSTSNSGWSTPKPLTSGRGNGTPIRGTNTPRGTLNIRAPPPPTNVWNKPTNPISPTSAGSASISPISPTTAPAPRGNPVWGVRGRGRATA